MLLYTKHFQYNKELVCHNYLALSLTVAQQEKVLVSHYTVRISYKCFYCNKNIYTTEKGIQKYCSAKCAGLGSRKFDITAKRLHKLVWKYPTTKVSLMLGVSDKAVEKRCKLLGVDEPPRGYWTKK